MIVAYQPGGTVRDVRVVLRFGEKLPNRFNTERAVVYMEGEDKPLPWTLVKDKYSVLPGDSELLSQPDVLTDDILPLTNEESEATLYEHQDIIRMDDDEPSAKHSSGDGGGNFDGAGDLVS